MNEKTPVFFSPIKMSSLTKGYRFVQVNPVTITFNAPVIQSKSTSDRFKTVDGVKFIFRYPSKEIGGVEMVHITMKLDDRLTKIAENYKKLNNELTARCQIKVGSYSSLIDYIKPYYYYDGLYFTFDIPKREFQHNAMVTATMWGDAFEGRVYDSYMPEFTSGEFPLHGGGHLSLKLEDGYVNMELVPPNINRDYIIKSMRNGMKAIGYLRCNGILSEPVIFSDSDGIKIEAYRTFPESKYHEYELIDYILEFHHKFISENDPELVNATVVTASVDPKPDNCYFDPPPIDPNKEMERAARDGDMETVQEMMRLGANNFSRAMEVAAKAGHTLIVQTMMYAIGRFDDVDRLYDDAIIAAAEGGHIGILMRLMATQRRMYGPTLDKSMLKAAEAGHKDVVKLLIDRGARNVDDAIDAAIAAGQIEIVQMLLDDGDRSGRRAMVVAAATGHIDIVKMILDRIIRRYRDSKYSGKDKLFEADLNDAMIVAARKGHKEIVQMMLDRGANNFNQAMVAAANGGHAEIVQMMLDSGANNFNEAMGYAVEDGQVEIVQMMLDRGANDFDRARTRAKIRGHHEIVKLIDDWSSGNRTTLNSNSRRSSMNAVGPSTTASSSAASSSSVPSTKTVTRPTVVSAVVPSVLSVVEPTSQAIVPAVNATVISPNLPVSRPVTPTATSIVNPYPAVNKAMMAAAQNGHAHIVKMMLDRGANNFNEVMIAAAEAGHAEIVQMMADRM